MVQLMGKRRRNAAKKQAKQEARRQRGARRRAAPTPLELAMGLGQWTRETGRPPMPPAALHALLGEDLLFALVGRKE